MDGCSGRTRSWLDCSQCLPWPLHRHMGVVVRSTEKQGDQRCRILLVAADDMGVTLRCNMGRPGNGTGAITFRISVVIPWGVTTQNNSADPDWVCHGRLWCLVLNRLVFCLIV